MEHNTYTPMGRKWTATGSGSGSPSAGPILATNRYRYNGKEEQALAAGMPYTDYGARLFDPDHCTWLSPDPLSGKYPGIYPYRFFDSNAYTWLTSDPLSSKYPGINPYAFCAGDPVNYVDPDGRKPRVYVQHGFPGHVFVTTSIKAINITDPIVIEKAIRPSKLGGILYSMSFSSQMVEYNQDTIELLLYLIRRNIFNDIKIKGMHNVENCMLKIVATYYTCYLETLF